MAFQPDRPTDTDRCFHIVRRRGRDFREGMRRIGILLGLLLTFGGGLAIGQGVEVDAGEILASGLTLELEEWVRLPRMEGGGGGHARLSAMRGLPDGRLFVNDQRGRIYRVQRGVAEAYFTIRGRVGAFVDQPGLGTGLHSFAFHPEFLTNGKLYTVHSENWNSGQADMRGPVAPLASGGQMSVLMEWTAENPSAATFAGNGRELLRVYFPGTIHCAQEISFNPVAVPGSEDYGLLYVCLGEGGGYLKGYWENEQRLDSPMGAVLRIDPAGSNSTNGQYGIPAGNPWATASDPTILREIYAYGFRNPHRINWDTGGTGRCYVGDIGERQIEELNLLEPGRNYGFPQREGTYVLDPRRPSENDVLYALPENDAQFGYTYPVAQYDHGEGLAIVGGPIYRGSLAPGLVGKVLFGDIVRGRIFVVEEDELQIGRQAPVKEVQLRQGGVLGSLPSFVGNSRADLRFGMDTAGELYIMTKTDGRIRRVIGSSVEEESGGGSSNDRQRWAKLSDFTEESDLPTVEAIGSGGEVRRVADPFGEGSNTVLKLTGAGTRANLLMVPSLSATDGGTVYLRFAFGEAGGGFRLGLGASAQTSFAAVQARFSGAGWAEARDGSRTVALTDALRPGTWYEAWAVLEAGQNRYSLYIRGDQFTAPTLMAASFAPSFTLNNGLQRLFLDVFEEGSSGAPVYIDDVQVDAGATNLSAPALGQWALVDDFENPQSVTRWEWYDQPQVQGVSRPTEAVSVIEEGSGNHALQVSAVAQAGLLTYARVPLPFRVEVSDTVTFYLRMQVMDFTTNQVWGLVNVPYDEIAPLNFDAMEVIGRWTDEPGRPALLLRDDASYRDSGVVPRAGDWVEIWWVVRNGGEASGGQTYDTYWRPAGADADPVLVYADAGFRVARETPMDWFQIIANNGSSAKTGAVRYDDLFVIDGEVLRSPVGTGQGLYPGRPGLKTLPWFGEVDDTRFPWIYHERLGWLKASSNAPIGAWHYDFALGWLWIQPDLYPYLYAAGRSSWLYFFEGFSGRWFFDTATGDWIGP
jgi:glucose/arabinose dehydrogenase